ncbi:OmpA family protein [Nonomuraea sp. NPDC046802]|uniref:OmpA family protein n=1 Tax=Nonomuraea sp. NPDC046802 TaxID=3154919 RepID=UPI0033FA9A1F
MSRFPELGRGLAAVLTLALAVGQPAQATPAQDPEGVFPVDTITFPVDTIRLTVESLDASESETREDKTVTVTLTSDVLFALDKADVTAKAKARLADVAEKIEKESAGGVIKIAGHTDDQGEKAYNLRLSKRRAESVRAVLAELLAGKSVTFEATGYGEDKPRVPNLIDNRPSEKNRALNRRVEIVYNAG